LYAIDRTDYSAEIELASYKCRYEITPHEKALLMDSQTIMADVIIDGHRHQVELCAHHLHARIEGWYSAFVIEDGAHFLPNVFYIFIKDDDD
jgi:hypothetical protein